MTLRRIVREDTKGLYVNHEGMRFRCPKRLVPRLRVGQRVRMNFSTGRCSGIAWLMGSKHEADLMWSGREPS